MKWISLLGLMTLFNSASAETKTIPVQVTEKGFEPAQIAVNAGESVTLSVTRKTNATCATEIHIPSLKMKKELPLNKTVQIDLGKVEKGEITFSCGMDMISGKVNIK